MNDRTPWTQGEWTAHIHTGPLDGEAHVNADGCCIAYVGFGTETERHYVTGEEAKANARLIAAAPEQHECLAAAPILSKYHTASGFEVERFITDYENWVGWRGEVLSKARWQS